MDNSFRDTRLPKKTIILLCISLAMILIGSIFASFIQSDWGKIAVSDVKFPTRDGQWVTADLYKPDSATRENPAPLIVVVAGFQRSRETQSGIALELARRGFVIINIDPYSQGDSSSSVGSTVATNEGYGAYDLINYIYTSDVLKYVDRNKIGITGHSAGGNAAYQAAVHFGEDAVNNNGVSKLLAAYISGYVLSIQDSSLPKIKSNVGMDYAFYDEGAFRNKPAGPENKPTADMSVAVESHIFVNSVLPDSEKIAAGDPVAIGKIYGSPSQRTMRQVYNTKTIHALQPYVSSANTALLSFFEIAMDFDYSIPANRHIWWLKELFTTISLLGAFIFIVPFASLLMKVPVFRSLKKPLPPPVKKRNIWEMLIFIGTIVLSAAIAGLTYIPMSKLTSVFFSEATKSAMTWWFPQRMNNAVLLWAVLNGIIGIVIFLAVFFISHYVKKYLIEKKRGLSGENNPQNGESQAAAGSGGIDPDIPVGDGSASVSEKPDPYGQQVLAQPAYFTPQPADGPKTGGLEPLMGAAAGARKRSALSIEIDTWGIKIGLKDFFKTLLLAICVAGGFYLILHAVYFFFHVDFRFLFLVAARPLNTKVVLQALMYVPLFFIFYLSNSIRVNGSFRQEGMPQWLSLLLAGLANSLGLIIILIIQYVAFGATGTVFWTETPSMTEWLYVNILFGLIPVMFILPYFNRWFFNITGKSWLGPMVTCIIFITMMINNSVAYIPLP